MRDSIRPLIGIACYSEHVRMGAWDVRAALVQTTYVEAITAAGGIAVLLPPQPVLPGIATRVLDAVDGLVIAGGADIDAARYGQQAHATNDAPRLDRDAWEDSLLTESIARDLPFLGICRGMQMINVHQGGTLHQHLPEVVGSERYRVRVGEFAENAVAVSESGDVGEILGSTPAIAVRSHHHQAVDVLGDGLAVAARSDDGTVQAIELAGVSFGVGVQWHPEATPEDGRLFDALVEASRARLTSEVDA